MRIFASTAIWAKLRGQDHDLYEMSCPCLSAGDAPNLCFHSSSVPSPNRMMRNDPETDRDMDAGNAAITPAARAAAFGAATKRVHEAVLWKPLVVETPVVVAGPRVAPFEPAGLSGSVFGSGLNLALR